MYDMLEMERSQQYIPTRRFAVADQLRNPRRAFFRHGWAFLALPLAGCSSALLSTPGPREEKTADILPTEYLMYEHGILSRVLLIYEESLRRMGEGRDFPVDSLASASKIVRNFIEDFHQKLEEEFVFPRFRKERRFVETVNALELQHKAGRKLTDTITRLAAARDLELPGNRLELARSVEQFVRLYRPHAAREDTVVFPALRGLVTPREFRLMGEEFEKRGEELYGYTGFYRVVDQVAGLERKFGIFNLAELLPEQAS